MDKVIYLDEEIKACVAKVSTKLLPALTLVDPNITGVHFQHGHLKEIIEALKKLSLGTTTKTERYPLVALLRDFPEQMGYEPGIYSSSKPTILIATRTLPDYNTDKRKEVSFKPILHPIMVELFNQLELSGSFLTEGSDLQEVTRIDHYFYGNKSVNGGEEKNIFSDWIDCVELNNLNLKLYTKNCQ